MLKAVFQGGGAAQSEQRREDREEAEGQVEVSGDSFPLIDWSSSGFKASGYSGQFDRGDRLPIEFTIYLDGESYYFTCKAFVVWASEREQAFAAAFVEMDLDDRRAVSDYFS